MNLTYQRAVQVLNDRFSNVEHALQVNQAERTETVDNVRLF